ncbi:HrpB1 family type III secretion system apparatus protein [Acidovorax sp. SUPP950]|uniref:HrpB1 family type III secretion system apparatus protein n=1 Tax=unclassified Acidovorax TaxID=2684926 RepID=UPI0023490970|nr:MULTISPECIES: HrpB1 family type III secretion system apparatus protein [Comamonadaceae]WCM97294.1 HrpB1 family type III secretion system apparatus protein [Acidovorax sp. GBBC 1281]WOI44560.1 HrpB1 family type III secretion system apparatus protein [Paracidovorax avenae]GKS77047.1 HrpB1 family type III secretion system apparatus protein [Acidovorax sp. SUPP950]GKS85404.1 HrpB1 family type III secretion system apparatus protein [Acidovorax sp. SUPP1855]GKS91771.1 HrpB1 family type III secret
MDDSNVHEDPIAALAVSLVNAIRENQLDEAETMLEELNALSPDTEEYLIFPVLIAIQRGYTQEALQYLNTLGEDTAPELKALCLNILGDPTWHYHAQSCLESGDEHVRKSMRELLQLEPEIAGDLA